MTDEQLADIRQWLQQASEPCGNDACIGEWAAVHGRALLDEVERLREEVERLEQVSSAEADDSLYFREELETLRETQAGQIESALAIKDGYIERLHAAVAEVERLREAQRWIPVSERMPKVGSDIWAYSDADGCCWTAYVADDEDYPIVDDLRHLPIQRVTYWMPQTKPPEVEP